MSNTAVPLIRRRIASLRIAAAVLAVLAISVLGLAQAPVAPIAGSTRVTVRSAPNTVLVKLRESLGGEVMAALPPGTLLLNSTTPTTSSVKDFLLRYRVSSIAPLFPEFARAWLLRGLTAEQVVDQTRRQFPTRSARFRGAPPPVGLDRIYILTTNDRQTPLSNLIARLKADPNVEYAQLDQGYSVNTLPNDPYLSSSGSWGQSYADLWGLFFIGAPAAWGTATGSGVTVAVIDTGIDLTHPDIVANLWTNPVDDPDFPGDTYGWSFVDSNNNPTDGFGHGTHVAGTIAATANNGIGIAGVAYNARVMAVKGLNDQGYGFDSTLAPALTYAADRGADVMNLSWGEAGTDQVIADAVAYAYSLGVVVVAAAGNNDIDATGFSPASLPDVITVAAIDPTGARANFSDFGPKIDVAAPGVDILSLQAAGTALGAVVSPGYIILSGTSMATPHVAGLAALVLSQNPDFTNEQVRQVLRSSASSASAPNSNTGYGVIQSAPALAVSAPLEAHIASPLNGLAASGIITISGAAQGAGFASYQLSYGSGTAPTSWTTFLSSSNPVSAAVLGTLDASQLNTGTFAIRLTVLNTSGAAFVDQVQISTSNAAFASPKPPNALTSATSYKPGGLIQIMGTAGGAGFQSYTLQWAPGADPGTGWRSSGITLTGGGTASVSNGVLGTWNTSGFNTAGYYTLLLTVYRTNSTDTVLTILYLQPDLLSSAWPLWLAQGSYGGTMQACSNGTTPCQLALASPNVGATPGGLAILSMDGTANQYQLPLPGYGSFHQPSVANLAGSNDQIVVADNSLLRVYNVTGAESAEMVPATTLDLTRVLAPIVDLAGNGTWTTLAFGTDWNTNLGYVYAWTGTGTPASGSFPIVVQDQNPINSWYNRVRVLAADVNGTGSKEIVVSEGLSPTTFTLRLYSASGTPLTWAVPQLSGMPESLAAADLDGNGQSEVVVVAYDTNFMTSGGYATIHVFQPNGSERAGWPQQFPITSQSQQSYLAIGNLAQNGQQQIVWASTMLCVLNADGTKYSSAWPLVQPANPGLAQGTYGPIVLADVDGDGKPEIVTTSDNLTATTDPFFPFSSYYDQQLLAYHLDGTVSRSWQLTGMNGYDSYTNGVPSIGNFSGQGTTEIAVAYYVSGQGGLLPGVVSILETGVLYNPASSPWPYAYGNPQNNPVLASSNPLAISGPVSLPSGTVDLAYPATTITATGGTGSYTWSATGLPPGMVLNSSTGILSGTPTNAANSPFQVNITVTDSSQATASQAYSLAIVLAYLVGDVYPFTDDTAGDFGDDSLNTLDLIAVLRAVTNIGPVPAPCSDRFDAMDSYPVDTATTRGGDGALNTLDLIVLLERVTSIDPSRPVRTPRTTCNTSQAQTQARRDAVAGTLELVPAGPAGDGWQRTAVFLRATADLDLAGLSFSLTSASDSQLRFMPSDHPPSIMDTGLAGNLALAWLNGWTARAGQRVLLGYAETPPGSSPLAFHALSASAASDGRNVVLDSGSSRRPPR